MNSKNCVAAFYHFTQIKNPIERRQPLLDFCTDHQLRGTILLAHEGINGTVCGSQQNIEALIALLQEWPEITNLDVKYSTASGQGFLRMKVRIKNEIVTMGKPDIDPLKNAGTYVEAKDWNDLISRDDVMVLDTRNTYETRIGSFSGAIDPKTRTFRAFPDWADKLKSGGEPKSIAPKAIAPKVIAPKVIAMYCTGGIRCEKASAYMKKIGFDEVYHLKGGILKYLETVPEEESLWQGECFVFDERISLKHQLQEGSYGTCFACKDPLSDADRAMAGFEEGVSCHRCIDTYSEVQKQKFRQRQEQIKLAESRGTSHLGQNAQPQKKRPD